MRSFWVSFLGLLFVYGPILSQAPKKSSSSDIFHALQKLNFLGTALYIAAHPDDENTTLISYLSNEVKANTAYLSLTRGDGGQNLIGPELRELLGVLRTEELLAARRIDGGSQFFTRANDFGYSKHPQETLKIWNKEEVLSDIIWIIRNYKPDIIINRFDHRSPGSTHGHHTSSALLSYEAFDLAARTDVYPEQLKSTETWQPKRIFFNTSWWFYGSQDRFNKADKSKLSRLEVGSYYPLNGLSNNEIAALASSQHLCQGFGRLGSRGNEAEYLEFLKGDPLGDPQDLFSGIDTSWSRVEGGKAVGEILYRVAENFNFTDPSQHLPALLAAHQALQKVQDGHWRTVKLQELENIILSVCGLYLEAYAGESQMYPGGTVSVQVEAINRSSAPVVLRNVSIAKLTKSDRELPLTENKNEQFQLNLKVPERTPYTSPYWLHEKWSIGMYKVADQNLIGRPETPPPFSVSFELSFNGYPITINKPIVYRYSRPDRGERYEPFVILPEATSSFQDKVILFSDGEPKTIPVTVRALKDNAVGEIQLNLGTGWQADQNIKPFNIAKKGDRQIVSFKLTPPATPNEQDITATIRINGKELTHELVEINYDHVPKQSVLLPSEAKVVRLNIQKNGNQIGYIHGAGDDLPKSLEQIGYTVSIIDPHTIQAGSLAKFDAVVLGVRAYNVIPDLQFKQRFLLDYVKEGGNLVVQYNTVLDMEDLAPYPLSISRDRVADEASAVKILAKDHPVMNFPNKITEVDFKHWVQERGLYFPNSWSKEFIPILSMHDEGEAPLKGSLLVAPYGKGNYIYTGLSFFRELPAGVSGAYKLFTNLLSLEQAPKKAVNK